MKPLLRSWRAKRKRLRLLQQVMPEEEVEELDLPPDVRSSKYINRPSFSLPLMTNNFRRFNARYVFYTSLLEDTELIIDAELESSSCSRTVSSVS